MRGVKRTIPLYMTCQRPECEAIKQVRTPFEQRTRKYCSQRCNGLANANIRRAGRKGVDESARRRKRRLLERVQGMTPMDAFRAGYKAGLRSKIHQIRRRYALTKRTEAA